MALAFFVFAGGTAVANWLIEIVCSIVVVNNLISTAWAVWPARREQAITKRGRKHV
ncbi:hypothetical protein ACFIQF_21585 [Comamonas sp. J-3]